LTDLSSRGLPVENEAFSTSDLGEDVTRVGRVLKKQEKKSLRPEETFKTTLKGRVGLRL